MFSFDETSNSVKAQQLHPLKTRAKDDVGKTYWVYSDEENVDTYEEKHILSVRPSLTLAKNIKRKEPVFALLNREFIEAFSSDLYLRTGFFVSLPAVVLNSSLHSSSFLFTLYPLLNKREPKRPYDACSFTTLLDSTLSQLFTLKIWNRLFFCPIKVIY